MNSPITRFADDRVKAVSRAQRGRSNAERLDGACANLRINFDGRDNGHADRVRNRAPFRHAF